VELLTLEGWAFIPGPRHIADPPGNSIDLHDVASYDPGEVADSLLTYPGCRLLHPASPTWWEWRAEWTDGDRFIALGMSLFETAPPTWGGSEVEALCRLEDIMGLWFSLRSRFSAAWLHNAACEVHTPESFCRSFAA
jgi:hypothetical protein